MPTIPQKDLHKLLLPYQQNWIDDPSQLKVAEKSRRIGLTWAEAADAMMIAAKSKAQGGSSVYYVGYNREMALEFIETCAWWASGFNEGLSQREQGFWSDSEEDKNILTFAVKFAHSQHRIVALSSRPANLRGKQGVFIIDEAAFHDKLDELLKGVLATLIWGGKARIISTHNGDSNPFLTLCHEIQSGAKPGSLHRITFQEAVRQGLYERIAQSQGKPITPEAQRAWVASIYDFYGEDAHEELDVVPRSAKGAYLPAALIEPAMCPDLPIVRLEYADDFALLPSAFKAAECQAWMEENLETHLDALNPANEHCFGQDFARSGHLSVICLLEIGQDLVRTCRLMLEMRNVPTRQQEQILWHILEQVPRLASGRMDAGGNGEILAEYTADRFGTHIEGIKLSNAFYGAQMPLLKSAFEDRLLQIPRDADIRGDLRSIQIQQGIPKVGGENKGGDGKPRHGDAAIALLLAYHASLSEKQEYRYIPVPKYAKRPSLSKTDPFEDSLSKRLLKKLQNPFAKRRGLL